MSEGVRTVAYFILSVISTAAICVISILFAGAGHGWSGGIISWFSIVSIPLAGIGWGLRAKRTGRICGGVSVLISLGGDLALTASAAKDSTYVERVWQAMPVLMSVWFILLLGWQLLGLAAFFGGPGRPLKSTP